MTARDIRTARRGPGRTETGGGRAMTAKKCRRVIAAQDRLTLLHQLANDLLRGHARSARCAACEMVIDYLSIGGRELTVDVRSDQGIDR
jgi:hypothetical protein